MYWEEFDSIYKRINHGKEQGIEDLVSFLEKIQRSEPDLFRQLDIELDEVRLKRVQFTNAKAQIGLYGMNSETIARRDEIFHGILGICDKIRAVIGSDREENAADHGDLVFPSPPQQTLLFRMWSAVRPHLLLALFMTATAVLITFILISSIWHWGGFAGSPSRATVTATPIPYTYTWNLTSNCSDAQGTKWQTDYAPYSPLATKCSGDNLTMTAGKNNKCNLGSNTELCVEYNLDSLPNQRPFGHSFDVNVKVKLDPPRNAAVADCAEEEFLFDNNANSYLFRICTNGEAEIFSLAASSAVSKCQSNSSIGTPLLFNRGITQYSIEIQVRAAELIMMITGETQTKTIGTLNNCFSPDVSGIGLLEHHIGDAQNANVTFSAFSYKEYS